jgi:hypothetical protein
MCLLIERRSARPCRPRNVGVPPSCPWCGARHRTARGWLACRYHPGELLWVSGKGRYASVSLCGGVTIELHQTEEQAEAALAAIAPPFGCGSRCHGNHAIEELPENLA